MFFQIDFGDTLPIYDQVVRQIKFAVAGGVLKENELVPSVRELARELTINPNTVARAYHRLQDDGILTSVRGTGLAVAVGAADRCRDERVELIRLRLEQVFAEARQSRIDPRKLRELVEEQLVDGFSESTQKETTRG
jgi:GntR family transcriptional regulator